MAIKHQVDLIMKGAAAWNQWKSRYPNDRVDLTGADLSAGDFRGINLCEAWLTGVNFYGANLSGAFLRDSDFNGANFARTNCEMTKFSGSSFSGASFEEANLVHADLSRSLLFHTNLVKADLTGANLEAANLVGADVDQAILKNCTVYGVSTWDLKGIPKEQSGLEITFRSKIPIYVDDLEVAQFLYLLLNNDKIRNVIQAATAKAVLILGRFSPGRKAVLDAVRTSLRETYGFVPIMFDFEPSKNRDLTETIQLLASMCRFVIADLTDAKSLPQELSTIIPNFPSIPIQPLIQKGQNEYAMFEHWRRFGNVLPEYEYEDQDHLLETLNSGVITPVKKWEKLTDKDKAKEAVLTNRIDEKDSEIARLKALLEQKTN